MNVVNSRLNDLTSLNNEFFESVQQNSKEGTIFLGCFRKYRLTLGFLSDINLSENEIKLLQEVKERVREISTLISALKIGDILNCTFDIESVLVKEMSHVKECIHHPTVKQFLANYNLVEKIVAFSKFASQKKIALSKYQFSMTASSKEDLYNLLNRVIDLTFKSKPESALKTIKAFYKKYPFITEEERLAAVSKIKTDKIHTRIDLYRLSRERRVTLVEDMHLFGESVEPFINNVEYYHFTRTKDIISVCNSIISEKYKIPFLQKIAQADEKKQMRILRYCLENRITKVPVFEAFYHTCLKIEEHTRYNYILKCLEDRVCSDIDGYVIYSLSEENRIRLAYRHHEKHFYGFCQLLRFYNITNEKI